MVQCSSAVQCHRKKGRVGSSLSYGVTGPGPAWVVCTARTSVLKKTAIIKLDEVHVDSATVQSTFWTGNECSTL